MSRDHIDVLCEDWARKRREVTGLRQPQLAKDFLGAVRCTLGERRDLHAGARSEGRVEQHWPELYGGESAFVNLAFHRMPVPLQQIMDLHYTLQRPRSKALRAGFVGISPAMYWQRVGQAKIFLEGAIAIAKVSRQKPRQTVV